MRTWVKLHTKILNSPDLDGLSDHQYRACMKLFALGGVIDCGGRLGTVREISYHLRLTEADSLECLQSLSEIDIVTDAKGVWSLVNWEKYQSHSPSSENSAVRERVKKHRENKPKSKSGNGVTPSLHLEGNDTRTEQIREEEIREEKQLGADAPATPPTQKPEPLTEGQKLFTERWQAKRLNPEQKTAIHELETQYGLQRLTDGVVWAREKNMALGQAIGSIRTALKHWGAAKPSNGSKPAPKPFEMTPEQIALRDQYREFKAKQNANPS